MPQPPEEDEGDRKLRDLKFLIGRAEDLSGILGHTIEERGDLSLQVMAALINVQGAVGVLLDTLSDEVDNVDVDIEADGDA
jgi:hypothetical protein